MRGRLLTPASGRRDATASAPDSAQRRTAALAPATERRYIDDIGDVVSLIPSVALAIAAADGLRAWLPLLATGLFARMGVVELGDGFSFMSSTPALVLFGVATVIEVAADKVPVVDHAVDAVSTLLRPAAGVLLASSVVWQLHDPLWATAFGLVVGAPVAAVPHVAKAGARAVSTTTTGGLANPALSLAEDVTTVALILLAVALPVVAAVLVVVPAAVWLRRSRRTKAWRRGPVLVTALPA